MLNFREYTLLCSLSEAEGKTCVFAFGRMNPVTKGHLKLMEKMVSEARKRNCTAILFLSHSQDSKKNPLGYSEKIRFARLAAPSGLKVLESPAKNVFDCLAALGATGYKNVIMVAGDDREADYSRYEKYIKDMGLDSLKVISAGARRGGGSLDNVENISASRLRELALQGNESDFIKYSALYNKPAEAKKMYQATRKGLGK